MKKILIVLVLLLSFLFFSEKVMRVYAVTFCGQVTRQNVNEYDCDNYAKPAENCAVDTNPNIYNCYLDDQNRCIYNYHWEGCSYQANNGYPICHYDDNYVLLDCSDSGGGSGGGDFNWFSCPAGDTKTCGLAAEAQEQGKYACLNRAFCDNYFSPELIGDACAYNDNGDPTKWICQSNCSCCPTGSYRSCTQGSQYTVNITIDLTNQSVEERTAAKVSCAQYHGHDDIFVSNVKTRDYYNQWDDHLQDWDLTCIQNTCGCVAPPTPTPTPLSCTSNINYSCAGSGAQATISWNPIAAAVGYILRLNHEPYDAPANWYNAAQGDQWQEPVSSTINVAITPGANYQYDVQGKAPGESYPYLGGRCPFSIFSCPAPTPTATPPSLIL